MVLDTKTEDMRKLIDWERLHIGERDGETIGGGADLDRSIYFLSADGSEKTRTPICPDCQCDLKIAKDSADHWELTCQCEQSPAFEIHKEK